MTLGLISVLSLQHVLIITSAAGRQSTQLPDVTPDDADYVRHRCQRDRGQCVSQEEDKRLVHISYMKILEPSWIEGGRT